MEKEILRDNYYRLSIPTYLFAILTNHVNQEYCEFGLEDFDRKRIAFMNCGIPRVYNCFTDEELISWLDNHPNLFYKSNDKWVAIMKNFIDDLDSLTKEELEFVNYNETLAKRFSLFCNLQVDFRIFNDNGGVASLLGCNFMFNEPNDVLLKK